MGEEAGTGEAKHSSHFSERNWLPLTLRHVESFAGKGRDFAKKR